MFTSGNSIKHRRIKTKSKYCVNPQPSNEGHSCRCDLEDTNEINCDGTTATIQESCNDRPCPGEYNVRQNDIDRNQVLSFTHNKLCLF